MPDFSEEEVTAGARALDVSLLAQQPETMKRMVARAVLGASGAVPRGEYERLREQIDWTVKRCNAAMGDGFNGTPNSAVAAVCDRLERYRQALTDIAKVTAFLA